MTTNTSVARAVFTGALLTRDSAAPSIQRENAGSFIDKLQDTVERCTSANVTSSKTFILRHILPSPTRTGALVKYILTIVKAWSTSADGDSSLETASRTIPSTTFKTLHILYLVHDILTTVTMKPAHVKSKATTEQLTSLLSPLVQLASCGDSTAVKQSREAVEDLLASWEKHSIVPETLTVSLRDAVAKASKMDTSTLLSSLAADEAQAALAAQRAKQEATKWVVPQSHQMPNDATAPWYELPAANGLYQKRTQGVMVSSRLPQGGYRLRNGGRQADAETQAEVESLLYEAKSCFDKYTDSAQVKDIDALGNMIWKDGINRKRRNCWGWSYDGVEQRQKLLRPAD